MQRIDKIIVGNDSALKAKYGKRANDIRNAISALLKADRKRGLIARYIPVDDSAEMAAANGKPASAGDEKSHKEAVDAIVNSYRPDYLVLLGSPDIIPHVSLNNPLFNPKKPDDDPDRTVPSDLPYACDAVFSSEPADFVGPTRVVSRLPDILSTPDINYFLNILNLASTATPLTRQDYAKYLGVSAKVWQRSTSKSLGAVFGPASAVHNVPPGTAKWPVAFLKPKSHFFNCHGDTADSHYYGQLGKKYPVAHDAAWVAGKISRGTVMAAECCYGAQLYDPALANGQMSIANVYLQGGAYAFWGSTTIAYGPSTTNNNADLICQYFFQEVLKGSSIGEAALKARQRLAALTKTISPTNLKTLAQFILLGDASLHCVDSLLDQDQTVKLGSGKTAQLWDSKTAARKLRRSAALDEGRVLDLFKRRASSPSITPPLEVSNVLSKIAAKYEVSKPSIVSKGVLEPHVPELLRDTPKHLPEFNDVQRFHLIFDRGYSERRSVRRIIEVDEANGQILMIRELFSR